MNCWEFKQCGRELGGTNAFELGVCPASTYIWFDGLHGGRNAGRACWVVPATMCGGVVQGDFYAKIRECGKCGFYWSVKEQEGAAMVPPMLLLRKLDHHS